jgi:thiosulfate/3-mercaptopyruvate sulfurtransferase
MMDKNILIVAEALEEKLGREDWALIDCRFNLADPSAGQKAYDAAHIPGAVYLDLDKNLAGPIRADTGRHPLPDVGQIGKTLGRLGISNAHTIVVYDDASGAVAARAWWILHWLGHDKVRLLDGGMARWQALGLATESARPAAPEVQFHARPRPELVVSTEQIEAAIHQLPKLNLLDARDAARFRGEVEPVDPIAGHIPGARNLPFSDFVDEKGTWLSLAERRERLLHALGENEDADWCVMCGSGVTACHLAISAAEAGLREPRLYVGSWSEWIRDPRRPIARK